jgi:hypothetical protein
MSVLDVVAAEAKTNKQYVFCEVAAENKQSADVAGVAEQLLRQGIGHDQILLTHMSVVLVEEAKTQNAAVEEDERLVVFDVTSSD